MQGQPDGIEKLAEFYHRHKTAVDALAERDELFQAVKTIASNHPEGSQPEKNLGA